MFKFKFLLLPLDQSFDILVLGRERALIRVSEILKLEHIFQELK